MITHDPPHIKGGTIRRNVNIFTPSLNSEINITTQNLQYTILQSQTIRQQGATKLDKNLTQNLTKLDMTLDKT